MKKNDEKLTNREIEVLNVFYGAGKPLISSDIARLDDSLNINTVQSVVRTLLRKGYIEVSSIVYSGSVLCRCYQPTDTAKQQTVQSFSAQFRRLSNKVPPSALFAALLQNEQDGSPLLASLELMIQAKKTASKDT